MEQLIDDIYLNIKSVAKNSEKLQGWENIFKPKYIMETVLATKYPGHRTRELREKLAKMAVDNINTYHKESMATNGYEGLASQLKGQGAIDHYAKNLRYGLCAAAQNITLWHNMLLRNQIKYQQLVLSNLEKTNLNFPIRYEFKTTFDEDQGVVDTYTLRLSKPLKNEPKINETIINFDVKLSAKTKNANELEYKLEHHHPFLTGDSIKKFAEYVNS